MELRSLILSTTAFFPASPLSLHFPLLTYITSQLTKHPSKERPHICIFKRGSALPPLKGGKGPNLDVNKPPKEKVGKCGYHNETSTEAPQSSVSLSKPCPQPGHDKLRLHLRFSEGFMGFSCRDSPFSHFFSSPSKNTAQRAFKPK